MLSILRISASAPQPSSAPYNQFTLPLLYGEYDLSFCSLASSEMSLPLKLKYYGADNSIVKLYKNISQLIRGKKFDIIHIHHLNVYIIFFFTVFFLKKALLKRSLFTFHTSYHLLSLRNKFLFLVCLMSIKRVICCSEASFRSLPSIYRKIYTRKIQIIQNGFDNIGVDAVKKSQKLQGKNLRILSVGRLMESKCPEKILRSFYKLDIDNAELVFVGDGPLKETLMRETERLGISKNVIFTGTLTRTEVYKWMCRSDIYISTSKGEGMPIAVLEAIYCGCFAILSKIPPHLEIDQGLNQLGFIDEPLVGNIIKQIKTFIEYTKEERTDIIRKSISHVLDRYSLKTMLNHYLSVYNSLSNKN